MNSMRKTAVDIVIPVYNAVDDLLRCVDSVLGTAAGDYRLLLIDDASPDPAVRAYFAEIGSRGLPHVLLLRNDANLGFTLTANRGMETARASAAVVLLNSDTIVADGWLDALGRCAESDATIGTITPFSNNAEICSFPRFCENNDWPQDRDPASMAQALREAAVPTYPDIPTGVGFCMYIRRELIDAIGIFDPAFGMGYGEENDFCLRAAAAGFRNVLCDDTFVVHRGGSSFGGTRTALSERNTALLLSRHPQYLDLVRDYIAADPLRPLRELAASHHRRLLDALPGMLHVIHGHGGGTEYHVRALIASARATFHQYLLIAVGDDWQLEEHAGTDVRSYDFRRLEDESWRDFLGGICARFGIELIHLHNISGCRDGLISALSELDLPYGYTVHDLNFACPTITFLNERQVYCGAVTDAVVCRRCLSLQQSGRACRCPTTVGLSLPCSERSARTRERAVWSDWSRSLASARSGFAGCSSAISIAGASLGSPTTVFSPCTVRTTRASSRRCSSTIACGWSPIHRQGRRRSASRCRKRGPPGCPPSCLRSARWRNASRRAAEDGF